MRKGELELNLIVVGIILLVVAVIVLYIFQHSSSTFQKGVSDCVQQGGTLMDSKSCADSGGRPAVFLSAPEGQVCCMGGA